MLVVFLEVACQAFPSWLSVGLRVILQKLAVLSELGVSELMELQKSVLDQSFAWQPVDSAASL